MKTDAIQKQLKSEKPGKGFKKDFFRGLNGIPVFSCVTFYNELIIPETKKNASVKRECMCLISALFSVRIGQSLIERFTYANRILRRLLL